MRFAMLFSGAAVSLACLLAAGSASAERTDDLLDRMRAALQSELDGLERGHVAAAAALAAHRLTEAGASESLLALCARPGAVDCAAVSPQGVMLLVEPPAYKENEGALIGGQPQVQRAILSRRPAVSALFVSVEGVRALDFERPVERGGKLLGLVSILVEPAGFFGAALDGTAPPEGGVAAVLQDDGRILWASRPDLVGLDLENSLLAGGTGQTAGRILAESEGGAGGGLRWTTLRLYDASWRLVLRAK